MKTPEVKLDADFSSLTNREREILIALAQGYSNREIAEYLNIGVKTVDSHRGKVRTKLNLRNNSDMTRYAIKNYLIDVDGKGSSGPPPVERFDPQTERTL